jgi:hypothetical protein
VFDLENPGASGGFASWAIHHGFFRPEPTGGLKAALIAILTRQYAVYYRGKYIILNVVMIYLRQEIREKTSYM